MKNIIIFDINSDFIKEAERLSKYGITIIKSDVENLINTKKIDAIVSPANSFGFMNGGIDKIYMNLFKDIQKIVQNKINDFAFGSNFGKAYLPIGSAITLQTGNSKCPNLICAPTMYLPGNIQNTNNVFLCFIALIYLAKMNMSSIIACPGLGTGVGMLTPKYAIDQIEMAILQYDIFTQSHAYQNAIKYINKLNLIVSIV